MSPSRWYRETDDRELDPPPVVLPCDQCGTLVRVHADDVADEPHRCVACCRATVRAVAAMPYPEPDEAVWF